jgi:phosphatidylglycerol---prolipoprotein diacylglyceryl transferase
MGAKSPGGKVLILSLAVDAANAIRFDDLGLSPIALDLGFFKLRWYSLSYIASILFGWWYLTRLLAYPGAPMAKRHADDFVFYATLGIILGGRLGYILFYKPEIFANPIDIFKLWEGGMSLHGGFLGTIAAIWWFCRKHGLNMYRVCDYMAVVTPIGLLLVRLANFVNGELWGRPSDAPWAMIFPGTGDGIPRHPSQLYEAFTEGAVALVILWWMFHKTQSRYFPGRLVGTGLILYGVARFAMEWFREPDRGLENLSWGLTMGQTLSAPMVLAGIWLVATAKARRQRVESIAGTASVA